MADLSLKQLRILKFLSKSEEWVGRGEMIEKTGKRGFSKALGAPTRGIKPDTLEDLKYVVRRDLKKPFVYKITKVGKDSLAKHEQIQGEVKFK